MYLTKPNKHKKDNSLLITTICSLGILSIIFWPGQCISSAITGAQIFFFNVFPSLFPFLVLTYILIEYNGAEIYSRYLGNILCSILNLPKECSLAIVISIFCGYPIGAKFCCRLYEEKLIDFYTLERLINIATNPSPIFVLGSIGSSMLSNNKMGYIILLGNYISCLVMSFLLKAKRRKDLISYKNIRVEDKNNNFGETMKESVIDSSKTTINIMGYIVLFSVVINLIGGSFLFKALINFVSSISNISYKIIYGLFLGTIEMTNGCYIISKSTTSNFVKLPILAFLVTFSGFSAITQVYSFTYKYKLSLLKYFRRKLLQGVIAALITIIILIMVISL